MFERFLEILQAIATALASIATSMQTGAAAGVPVAPQPGATANPPAATPAPARGPGRPPKAASATPAAGPAATPAANSTSAGPAPAASGADFAAVTAAAMELAKKPVEQGGGREALLAVLKHFLPNEAKPSLSMLQPLNRNDEILAHINGTPAGAGTEDDALFS